LRQRCRISVCFFAPSANAATIVFLRRGRRSEAIPAISIPQMNSLAWAEMVQMDPQTTLPVPVAVAAHTLKISTFLYRFLLPSPRPEFG